MLRSLPVILLLLVALPATAWAQTGVLVGTVTDAQTGEPLPGAAVQAQNTTLGAATGIDGRYRIPNVPAGERTFVAAYLGYQSATFTLTIPAGETVTHDLALSFAVIGGQEVVVTAQAAGQVAAINQQLASNTITNVVSKDRIQEYPDNNAAESVGRLPGVSLVRDGGEGAKVNVRGLSPDFNSITINGERIPSTDPDDRSVDLSLISSDLLEGIELFKALTPDKDADAIGGTVNLVVRKAPAGFRGSLRAEGGFNDLAQSYDNGRFNASFSNRFANNKVGVIATLNYQSVDRSSEGLEADYSFLTSGITNRSLNLVDLAERRERYGGSLTLDYDLGNGELQLRSLYSRTDRDDVRRRLRYRVGENDSERNLRQRTRSVDLISTGLSGRHGFGGFEVDYQVSYARSVNKTPEGFDARFRQIGIFPDGDEGVDEFPLEQVTETAVLDLDQTFFRSLRRERQRSQDADVTAQLNLRQTLALSDQVTAEIKAGGKLRSKRRTQDFTRDELLPDDLDELAADFGYAFIEEGQNRGPAAAPFITSDFEKAAFLGDFNFLEALGLGELGRFNDAAEPLYLRNAFFDRNDFEAEEDVWAGYLMGQFTLGPRWLLVGGVRYEYTDNRFEGVTGNILPDIQREINRRTPGVVRDTTGGQQYGFFFPQAITRVTLTDFLDLRAAVTRTLARPDYLDLVAFENIDDINNEIDRGNAELQATTAWNYDVGLTLYNRIGLFAVGGFYKQLSDFQYETALFETIDNETFTVFQTQNGEDATIYGIEVDVQKNFRYLPFPLNGLLLNANYAYAQSEAQYPVLVPARFDTEEFRVVFEEQLREDRLVNQSPHVLNVGVGYEQGGFSARFSLSYQSAFLTRVTNSQFDIQFPSDFLDTGILEVTELRIDEETRDFTILDLQLTQRVPQVKGLRVSLDLQNLTNAPERAGLVSGQRTDERFYGFRANLGLRYTF
ncbi:MAG: TonB-dependent receptor [Bacteroidota bacterium]